MYFFGSSQGPSKSSWIKASAIVGVFFFILCYQNCSQTDLPVGLTSSASTSSTSSPTSPSSPNFPPPPPFQSPEPAPTPFGGGGSQANVPLPNNSWQMIATHGIPVQTVGWEKLIYSSALKMSVMLGNYHQQSTEPNASLVAYDFTSNRWNLLDMGGLFHEENMPDAGHTAGMFVYDPNQNTYIYYCCASGAMEPENPWHLWWFDPIGQVGRDKHSAPKPGMIQEGGAAFDVADNTMVLFAGTTWTYNPLTNAWTEQTPNGTPPPAGLALTMMAYDDLDHKIYLFGGRLGYGTGSVYENQLYTYDVPTNTWTLLNPQGALPAGREKAGFAYDSTNNVFLLYGGHNDSGTTNPPFGDTWIFSPNTQTWTQLTPTQSPQADAPFERLVYDSSNNAFVMVLEGPNGFADGYWAGPYVSQTWFFRYQGSGPNVGTTNASYQPVAGSLNRYADGWAKEPVLAASGGNLFTGWVETGHIFDGSDATWSHVYVDQYSSSGWGMLGSFFNSVNSELTTTSGHSESHNPSLAVIGATPWVSYYQGTPDNSHPIPPAIYVKQWNGTAWSGGPIGLVNNNARVFQSRSQLTGVNGLPDIAFIEVDKTIYPQEAFCYVKEWNGTSWNLKGSGALNRNVGAFSSTPLSIADSVSAASDGATPYVAWTEYTTDTASVNQTPPQVYVSKWDGSQWASLGGSLNNSANDWAYDVSLTIMNAQPYVAFTERTAAGQAQVYVKTYQNGSWISLTSNPLNRNTSTGWAFRPAITADPSTQTVYVGWTEQPGLGQKAQTYVSQYSNGTWTTLGGSLNMNPASGSAQRLGLTVFNGQPIASWGEVALGSMREVFVKKWTGSQWQSF